MTPMSATASSARSARGLLAAFAVAAALGALAAGCGGSDSEAGDSTAAEASVAAAVEQALYEKGDTQEISCESLGTVEVAGVSREVARCSFSEEKDGAGEMRARGGCFVLEDGAALDVTMDVPADVTCVTKT
jgi:hypothetical protein